MSNLAFDKINIELMGNSAIIRSPSKCGRADAAKTVKITTLVRAFQDQDRGMETPILPKNTLKYVERGNKAIIYVYSEPTHFKATVGDQIYENCSRPGLVMIIELNMEGNAWSVRDSKIFAIKDDRLLINNETKLYGLPFPNISDDGWICWGSNASGGTFHSLTGLGMLIDRLFGSPLIIMFSMRTHLDT